VLKGVADDQSVMTSASSRGSSASSKKNKAMQSVLKAAKLWLSTLSQIPQTALHVNDKIIDAQATPLERFIIRESERGNLIMKRVSTDLDMVKSYSEGILKSTNEIRYLFTCFSKGQLPVAWGNSYESPPGLSIGAWVNNLADRCASIGCSNNHDETAGNIESTPSYWLGGMFSPEAFITATRQLTAQMKQWSLEELELYLDIGVNSAEGIEDTIVRNMILECAQWSEADGITLSSSLRSRLPTSRLRWRRREDKPSRNLMTFPVYLDETRANLVVEVLIEIPDGVAPVVWSQRGVAIVLQSV
jgi:dynein heavy chain 1